MNEIKGKTGSPPMSGIVNVRRAPAYEGVGNALRQSYAAQKSNLPEEFSSLLQRLS